MSLAFDLRKRYLVMVENNGAVENLPSDAMVEIPAYITDRGPEPVRVGEIPTFYESDRAAGGCGEADRGCRCGHSYEH